MLKWIICIFRGHKPMGKGILTTGIHFTNLPPDNKSELEFLIAHMQLFACARCGRNLGAEPLMVEPKKREPGKEKPELELPPKESQKPVNRKRDKAGKFSK